MSRYLFGYVWRAAVICVLVAGGAAAQQPTVVRYGDLKGTLAVLPHDLAKGLGLFNKIEKERGVRFEFTPFTAGPDQTRSLSAGQLDMASSMYLEIAVPMALGEPLSNVLVFDNAGTSSILVATKYKAATLPELRQELGRPIRVGVTALGAGTELLARSFLDNAGVSRNDYQIIPTGGVSAYFPSLAQGRVDVVQAGEPAAQKLADKKIGRFIVDGWNRSAIYKLFGSDFQVNGVHVRNEFIQKHPDIVQAVVDAQLEAMKFLRDNANNPDAVIKLLPKDLQEQLKDVDAPKVIQRLASALSEDGCPTVTAARAVQKSLEGADLLKPATIDWSNYLNTNYIKSGC